jgi:hypothetical protein
MTGNIPSEMTDPISEIFQKLLHQAAESCKIVPIHLRTYHKQKCPENAVFSASRAESHVPGAGLEPARALRLNGF